MTDYKGQNHLHCLLTVHIIIWR